jgi:hypothetical protein
MSANEEQIRSGFVFRALIALGPVLRPEKIESHSYPIPQAVMHTRQRDETENDRDISRIVETLATLAEIFRKTARHKLKTFAHFKEDDYSMAITVGVKSSRDMGVSARMRA